MGNLRPSLMTLRAKGMVGSPSSKKHLKDALSLFWCLILPRLAVTVIPTYLPFLKVTITLLNAIVQDESESHLLLKI